MIHILSKEKFRMKHKIYNISGAYYARLGQLDAAVKSYKKVIAIKPDSAEAHYNLGATLQRLGQLDAAVKSYKKVIAINPNSAEAHYNLGATLQRLGQLFTSFTSCFTS